VCALWGLYVDGVVVLPVTAAVVAPCIGWPEHCVHPGVARLPLLPLSSETARKKQTSMHETPKQSPRSASHSHLTTA
jgi:hypothetical protein